MSSASSAVTYTSVYTDSEPGRVFWGADEEISDGGIPRVIVLGYDGLPIQPVAPPSPDYIPGPEDPQTPPVPQDEDEREPMFVQAHDPDYVPEPIYPEYIPLEDEHEFPAEEQPLPLVDSPTAESPGYVTESDPEEDPEEYEDDETEDGPVYYPIDKEDDGDDDDEDSSRDDANDKDEDEDEEDEEEEEHLAPADSTVVVPADEPVSPPEGTEPVIPPPSTDITIRARIIVLPHAFISLLPEAEVERLLAMTTPSPSPPISLSPPFVGERLARYTAPPAHSSPPLVPSPLLTPSGCPTQIQTLRIASTQALIDAVTAALPSPPLPPLLPSLYIPPPVDCRDDIPESEQPPCKRLCLSTLGSRYEIGESSTTRPTKNRGVDYRFISTVDVEARWQGISDFGYGIRDTWVDPAETVPEIAPMTVGEDSWSHISQRVDMDSQRVDLLMGDRMTLQEIIWMVEEEAYTSREAWAHSIGLSQMTHQELHTHRDHVYAHETHLQAHQTQLQLQGTLIQTQHQVKFATCTLLGAALTWWNGQIRTLGPEAYAMTWEVLKKKMTDKYCPQGQIKKLEIKLWNLKVKGNDVPAYTERFQELTLISPKGNGCFECGAPGYFKKNCPKLKNKDGGNGNAQGWVYVVRNAEKRRNASGNPDSNVFTGMFLLNNHYASILFDTGADRSFISTAFSSLIDIVPTPLHNSYEVELTDGKIVGIDTIIRGCTLNFLDHPFHIDLMPVELGSFDVIIGMDWLRRCHAVIVCDEKLVQVPYGNETLTFCSNERESRLAVISYSKAQEYMAKGCQVFLAQISAKKEDEDQMFPEDLLGLPPARPVEFQIDLIPGAVPVARTPYRLAPSEMKELLEQFVLRAFSHKRSSISLVPHTWGVPRLEYESKTFQKMALTELVMTHLRVPGYAISDCKRTCCIHELMNGFEPSVNDYCFNLPYNEILEASSKLEHQVYLMNEDVGGVIRKDIPKEKLEPRVDGTLCLNSRRLVAGHGIPVSIIYDRDGRFTSNFWKSFQKALGIDIMIDFGKGWVKYLPLAEFSYNNSYHASINAAPYEVLYGRKCQSSACWAKVGEAQLTGPELIQETTEKIVLIEQRMQAAQDRQKSYANRKRNPMEVLAKVGKVSYKLELPQELSRVRHTFHVSNLKKYNTDEPLVMPLEGIHVDDKLQFMEEPVEIMEREIKRLKRSQIPLVKVCWNSRRGPEFTWECEDSFKQKYP
ncbi:putative reverse transcriptase domain-containing protein [Tanacetum coccineum]